MSKKKVNSKGKNAEGKQSSVSVNVEAGRQIISEYLAENVIEKLLDAAAENVGMEVIEADSFMGCTILNGIGSGIVTKMSASEDDSIATAGKYIGDALVRRSQERMLERAGLGNPALTVFIQECLKKTEVQEAISKLSEQDKVEDAIVRLSKQKESSVTVEKEPVVPVLGDDNEAAGGRLYGLTKDSDGSEAMLKLLKDGVKGHIEKVSVKHPMGCQAAGCSAVITDVNDLAVATDAILSAQGKPCAGLVGISCGCYGRIKANNAKFVGNEAEGKSVMDAENNVSISDEELQKLQDEYSELIAQEKHAADKVVQAAKRAELVTNMADEADKKAAALSEAVENGAEVLKEEAAKAAADRDGLTTQAVELIDSTKEARALLETATKERTDFSIQHEAHMELLEKKPLTDAEIEERINAKHTNDDKNPVRVELEDLNGKKLKDTKKAADPYPNLDPTDKCGCGSGRMYKNCCGARAFCNPKNGKIRKAKVGDIRKSEWLAKNK